MQIEIRRWFKLILKCVLGDYAPYLIFTYPTTHACHSKADAADQLTVQAIGHHAVAASGDPFIREQAFYAGEGCNAYACFHDSRIAGVCFYWHGARYLKRNFWPLSEGEAKLVQIVTSPSMRGRGVATALIARSSEDMILRGYHRLYARVWHSNAPSTGAFIKAGWTRIAFVLEINPFRRLHAMKIRIPLKASGRTQ